MRKYYINIMQMLLDIKTHSLESIPFHLVFILTVLEMSLFFLAVSLLQHHVVVMM